MRHHPGFVAFASIAFLAFASCDQSTSSSPADTVPTTSLPLLHAGSDTTIELAGGTSTGFTVPTRPTLTYAISTSGTTDTKLVLLDQDGDTLAWDLRTDSVNGLLRWTADSSSRATLRISGNGRTTIRFLQIGGADSTEPDNTPASALLARPGASPSWHTLTPGDTDWVKFPVDSGRYYRIRTESDSSILLQARSSSSAWNSETPAGNVLHATVDSFVYVRVRKAGKTGSAGYSLRVDIDSTTFATTEPNPRGKATLLKVGGLWTSLYLENGIADQVSFEADSGVSYRLETRGGLAVSTKLVASDSFGAPSAEGYAYVVLKASRKGRMFGYIDRQFGSTPPVAGEYQIRILKDTANRDAYESDDTRSLAKLLAPGSASAQKHYLTPFEEDWVKFRVDSGRSYQVSASTNADLMVRIYTDSVSGDSYGDIVSTAGFKSGVTGYAFAVVNSLYTGTEGAYTLSLSADSTTDVAEPDDSRSTAFRHDSAGLRRHLGCGDVDWTSFSVDSGKSYTVSAHASGSDAGFVTTIYCGDGNDELESGWSSNYRTDDAAFTAPATGTCYVKVKGSYTWNRGDYTLTIK